MASWYTAWDAPNVHFYFLMLHICGFLCCLDMVLNDSFKEITRFIYMRKVMICILTGDGRIVHLWAVCQLVKLAQRWHCTVVFDIVSPGFVSRLQQLLFIPSLSLSLSLRSHSSAAEWQKSLLSEIMRFPLSPLSLMAIPEARPVIIRRWGTATKWWKVSSFFHSFFFLPAHFKTFQRKMTCYVSTRALLIIWS